MENMNQSFQLDMSWRHKATSTCTFGPIFRKSNIRKYLSYLIVSDCVKYGRASRRNRDVISKWDCRRDWHSRFKIKETLLSTIVHTSSNSHSRYCTLKYSLYKGYNISSKFLLNYYSFLLFLSGNSSYMETNVVLFCTYFSRIVSLSYLI